MLSRDGHEMRFWGDIRVLRGLLAGRSIGPEHYGFRSSDDNDFERAARILRLSALVLSNEGCLLAAADGQSPEERDEVLAELGLIGHMLEGLASHARLERERIARLASMYGNAWRPPSKSIVDLVCSIGHAPGRDTGIVEDLEALQADILASAKGGDRNQVGSLERLIQADPARAFHFDAGGTARLQVSTPPLPAGHFEAVSIANLRKAATSRTRPKPALPNRLYVMEGVSPLTDIGSLQATAGPGTLFQVASQFNCLESPGPMVVPIAAYFHDPTQGPRAAISAFSGTFQRHYAAPGPAGTRIVQQTGGPQLNLLEDVCEPGIATVRNGYLTSSDIVDGQAFLGLLESRFEQIRVGVHNDLPVVLGYNWDGAVTGSPRIAQVFTSTLAAGQYSTRPLPQDVARGICRLLLRAAYLGTLLAAVTLERRKVVLTMIGGGAFANPIPLIWESILWAIDEVEHIGVSGLEIMVNGRTLGDQLPQEQILGPVRQYDGAVIRFGSGAPSVQR